MLVDLSGAILATSAREKVAMLSEKCQCRFSPHEHTLDLQAMEWVAPDEEINMKPHASSAGEIGTE